MSFNYALAQEIYGGTPWMMDSVSFMSMSAILKDSQNGVKLELPQVKYNTPQLMKSDTRIITRPFGNDWSPGQLENNDSFDGIGIINLDGAITLSGGMSSVGMEQLSQMMLLMSDDRRMKAFVVRANSGGGSSAAVETMSDAILAVRQKGISVYASIKKGGMAASACYGIISSCEKIFSESEMNIVGSVGTMIQFEGRKANTTDEDGVKYIRVYATKSVKKNEEFEKALNEDSYDLLLSDLLDPVNENFISKILLNRPQLEGSGFDDGHTIFSKDAIGTFIDGIASFDEVVNMILSDTKQGVNNPKNNNSIKSNTMTKEEIRSQFPTVYSEIMQEGVASEQERRASWNVFREVDSKAVEEGIASGLPIKQSETSAFLLKATNKGKVEDLKNDNAPDVVTGETKTGGVEVTAEEKEVKEAFSFDLKK